MIHRFRWQNFFALSLASVALAIFGILFIFSGIRAGAAGFNDLLVGVLMLAVDYFVFRLANRLSKDLRERP